MCNILRPKLFVSMLSVLGLFGSAAYAQNTLNDILARGTLNCGVNSNDLPGFSVMEDGNFSGFDVDYCRAIAAAVFGNKKDTVNFVPLTSAKRFEDLRYGIIDVLIRVTTHTLSRDSATNNGGEGANFAPTIFYDGQGFMTNVPDTDDIFTVAKLKSFLSGNTVCVEPNTTTADNLAALGTDFSIVEVPDIYTEYGEGGCNVATSDKSALAAGRTTLANPADSLIFSVTISKEPLGPVVRHGDDEWYDIVSWVVYATFFAEEHEMTMENVRGFRPNNPEEERFMGRTGDLGAKLGLSRRWAVDVIREVGNYGEIFDRNLTGILPRDPLNTQYTNGGLLYAPPFN